MDGRAGAREPVVWMFSGQGGQYFHMGRQFFDTQPVFRAAMQSMDAVVIASCGRSALHYLYDPGRSLAEPMDDLVLSHPAVFMVQVAMARMLQALGFPAPDLLLGASLGEFVAVALAGVDDADAMLADLVAHARLFARECAGGGLMAVVDRLPDSGDHPVLGRDVELAGVNFDGCFTVAGPRPALQAAAARLLALGVPHQLLPVPVGFHSSQVAAAQQQFLAARPRRPLRTPSVPIVSCGPPPLADGERFDAAYWWRMVRAPLDLPGAYARAAGLAPGALWLDLGPAGSMATFARYNLPREAQGRLLPLMTPYGRDTANLQAARERLVLPRQPALPAQSPA